MRTATAYLLAFLIPLAFRALPELGSPYPLGVDTPTYMYWMGYAPPRGPNPYYLLLGLLGAQGLQMDPMLFFKVYPTLAFAATALLIAIYIRRRMGWPPGHIVLLAAVYTLTPALLRTSADLHRQSFALMLLALALALETLKLRDGVRWALTAALYILIGLTHELVFTIALAILTWRAIASGLAARSWRPLTPLLPATAALAAYITLKPNAFLYLLHNIFVSDYHPLGVTFTSEWQRLDWWASLTLLAYGFTLPPALLGLHRDSTMTPWLLAALTPHLTFPLTHITINLPDRWLYLAAIPIAYHATNFLRRLNWRSLPPYSLIAIIAIQPLSMIGITPLPLSIYAEKRYGTFTDLLTTSVPQEQIRGLEVGRQKLEALQLKPKAIITPYTLTPWAQYIYNTIPAVASDRGEAAALLNSHGEILYVAHPGQKPAFPRPATLILKYGELEFYIIT